MTEKNKQSPSDEELVRSARDGEKEAFTLLIQRYLPVVRKQAGRYSSGEADRDDLIQEGLIGLVNAVKSYDSSKNTSFHTYSIICITSKMLSGITMMRSSKHHAMHNYLSIDQLENSGESQKAVDGDSDPFNWYVQQEEQEFLQKQISTLLSELEQETLTLYLSGHSYEEMAEFLHTNTKAVDNALQRVRKKLRDIRSGRE